MIQDPPDLILKDPYWDSFQNLLVLQTIFPLVIYPQVVCFYLGFKYLHSIEYLVQSPSIYNIFPSVCCHEASLEWKPTEHQYRWCSWVDRLNFPVALYCDISTRCLRLSSPALFLVSFRLIKELTLDVCKYLITILFRQISSVLDECSSVDTNLVVFLYSHYRVWVICY